MPRAIRIDENGNVINLDENGNVIIVGNDFAAGGAVVAYKDAGVLNIGNAEHANGIIVVGNANALNINGNVNIVARNNNIRQIIFAEILLNGHLLVANNQNVPVVPQAIVPINYGQSIHATSVHTSTSEAGIKLMERYSEYIKGDKLGQVIGEAKKVILDLSDDTLQNVAAKRCIQRISIMDHSYHTDRISGLSIQQFLALSFLAATDLEVFTGNFKDTFVSALYEIQRGYNISENGVDDNLADNVVCLPGTSNKFIEKLTSTHPDCCIIFMTIGTATRKIPCVVREEAICYLSEMANNLQSSIECLVFTGCVLPNVEKDIEFIFEQIRPRVEERIYDEFGALFAGGPESEQFKDYVYHSSIYALVEDLSELKQHIQTSEGYRQYCSQTMQNFDEFTGLFFSSRPTNQNQEGLISICSSSINLENNYIEQEKEQEDNKILSTLSSI